MTSTIYLTTPDRAVQWSIDCEADLSDDEVREDFRTRLAELFAEVMPARPDVTFDDEDEIDVD